MNVGKQHCAHQVVEEVLSIRAKANHVIGNAAKHQVYVSDLAASAPVDGAIPGAPKGHQGYFRNINKKLGSHVGQCGIVATGSLPGSAKAAQEEEGPR